MTAASVETPVAADRWQYLPPGAGVRADGWGVHLARTHLDQLAAEGARLRTRHAVEGPLADTLRAVASAFDHWWPLEADRVSGLELVVASRTGTPRAVVLHDSVIRVGSDPGCHVQLDAAEVADEQCEIRVDADHLWLVDLKSGRDTLLNGYRCPPFEARPLAEGDEIGVAPFTLMVGPRGVHSTKAPCEARYREPLWLRTLNPFDVLGSHSDLWVRIRSGLWEGYARLPVSWVAFAYQALDYPQPTGGGAAGNEVDRSITSFLVERLAASVAESTGRAVQVSSLRGANEMLDLGRRLPEIWEGAVFDLVLAGQTYETALIWPADQPSGRPDYATSWLARVPLEVSVVAGVLALTPENVAQIDYGDIILPDRWYPGGWIDPEAEEPPSDLGSVELALQGWTRNAALRLEDGRLVLEPADEWIIGVKGEAMPSNEPVEAHAEPEEQPLRIPDELEMTVSFELDRISVPLKELVNWQPGATVTLDGEPDDPVRILLHQGPRTRVVGSGRVMVVEGKLGIQIDDWTIGR